MSRPVRSPAEVAEMVAMYTERLMPMIEIARIKGITRMGVYKILKSAGVNTSKAAAHISKTCANCGKPIVRIRCQVRDRANLYCGRECYGEYIRKIRPELHRIVSRNGMRNARAIMREVYDLGPEMVIHHLDGDETNNALENLAVFENSRDHLRYHRGWNIEPITTGNDCLHNVRNIMKNYATLNNDTDQGVTENVLLAMETIQPVVVK
jgi:hypothetical protein